MNKMMLASMAAALAFTAGAADFKLKNDDFIATNGKINNWYISGVKPGNSVTSEAIKAGDDDCAIVLKAVTDSGWMKVNQLFAKFTDLPKLAEGQSYEFEIEYKQKCDNVTGMAMPVLEFYNAKGQRVKNFDGPRNKGTFDWKKMKFVKRVKASEIPADATQIGIAFYLGLSTGTTWYADPEVEIEVK